MMMAAAGIALLLLLPAQELKPEKLQFPEGEIDLGAWSSDGKTVATLDARGALRLWDVATGRTSASGQAGFPRNGSIAFSADGRWLVTPAGLLDPRTAKLARQWPASAYPVGPFALSPDSSKVALASKTNLLLCDTATGKIIRTLSGHTGDITCVDYSRDGKTIATGGKDLTVRVWDAATARELHLFKGHTGGGDTTISSVRIRKDGKTVISATADSYGDPRGQHFILTWRAEQDPKSTVLKGPDVGTLLLELSGDDKLLLSYSRHDDVARLWDLDAGRQIGSLALPPKTAFLKLSPDGRRILWGNSGPVARIFDTAAFGPTYLGPPQSAGALAVRADGSLFATGGKDRIVRVWQPDKREPVRTLEGAKEEIVSLAFAGDGKLLLAGSKDGSFAAWDAETGAAKPAPAKQDVPPLPLVPISGGRHLAVSSGKSIRILDPATGADVRRLEGHPGEVQSLAPYDAGKKLVVLSAGGSLVVWTPASDPTIDSREVIDGEVKLGLDRFEELSRNPPMSVSPDGRLFGFGGRGVWMVSRWEEPDGRLRLQWSGGKEKYPAVLFSPDGQWFVAADQEGRVQLNSAAGVPDIAHFQGRREPVSAMAFLGPELRLLVAYPDGSVFLWLPDVKTGTQFFKRSDNPPTSLAAGNRWAAIAGAECISVWDGTKGGLPRPLERSKGYLHVAVREKEGEVVGVAASGKQASVWNIDSGALIRSMDTGGGVPTLNESGSVFLVATARSWEVWSVDKGKKEGSGDSLLAMELLALNSRGNRVLTRSRASNEDGLLRVVEASGSKEIRSFGPLRSIHTPTLSPDGNRIAVCGQVHHVAVYDVAGGKLLKQLGPGEPYGERMSFRGDGKVLAVAAKKFLRVWDVDNQKLMLTEHLGVEAPLLAWTPDGRRILVGVWMAEGHSVRSIDVGEGPK